MSQVFEITNLIPHPPGQKRMKTKRRSKFTEERSVTSGACWYIYKTTFESETHTYSRYAFDLAGYHRWWDFYVRNVDFIGDEKKAPQQKNDEDELTRPKTRWRRRKAKVARKISIFGLDGDTLKDATELAGEEGGLPCHWLKGQQHWQQKVEMAAGDDEGEEVRFEDGEREEWFGLDMIERGEEAPAYNIRYAPKKSKGKKKKVAVIQEDCDTWEKSALKADVLADQAFLEAEEWWESGSMGQYDSQTDEWVSLSGSSWMSLTDESDSGESQN